MNRWLISEILVTTVGHRHLIGSVTTSQINLSSLHIIFAKLRFFTSNQFRQNTNSRSNKPQPAM